MLPWWYRFLPYENDPECSTMEIRLLMPLPADGTVPPSDLLGQLRRSPTPVGEARIGAAHHPVRSPDRRRAAGLRSGLSLSLRPSHGGAGQGGDCGQGSDHSAHGHQPAASSGSMTGSRSLILAPSPPT